MPTVNILGLEYEARPLTPPERWQWNAHISRVHASNYWPDLHESIQKLSPALQTVVVSRCPLPARLSKVQYFEAATKLRSVQKLVKLMIVEEDHGIVVTHDNAAEIFWALAPLILNEAVVFEGGDALEKLRQMGPEAAFEKLNAMAPADKEAELEKLRAMRLARERIKEPVDVPDQKRQPPPPDDGGVSYIP